MKNILVATITLLFLACNGASVSSESPVNSKIDIEKELAGIEETRSNFTLAIKEGRYEDIGKWVSPDVNTIRAGGQGFDEMYALGKERGSFPYDSIIMTPTETHIMNDSMAYDWGSSKTYYTDKKGQQVELLNSFLVILKKIDGDWKLHREVASSVVN